MFLDEIGCNLLLNRYEDFLVLKQNKEALDPLFTSSKNLKKSVNTVIVSKEINTVLLYFSIKFDKYLRSHTLRESFIIELLRTHGLEATNRLLGNLNINCTAKYMEGLIIQPTNALTLKSFIREVV